MTKIEWQTDKPFDSFGDTLIRSNLMVLKSAAGFYIGHLCKTIKCNPEDLKKGYKSGLIEPYNRLSGYYPTRTKAEEAMDM
jgi:hypothetical protein